TGVFRSDKAKHRRCEGAVGIGALCICDKADTHDIIFVDKAEQRILLSFIRLTLYLEENAKTQKGITTVTLPCSLTEFAEYLGVGRASLYRTLDAMEADGAISRKGRVIRILKEL
ncbi:MAG: winged helix-turn-helix domain-containing protein, partial [Clostridia bacterium]|nr:winged helix-turn-helix domain-containing protein [Clostridia bacterium]